MPNVEMIAVLLALMVPLVALAGKLRVAYPIVLILSGVAIGYVPGIPAIALPPDVVLVLFLPGLVYWGAVTAPAQEFEANARRIGLLVVVLVSITTLAVAVVVHSFLLGLGWAAAFVLGAIVAPTDAVAIEPVAARVGLPRQTLAIVQGESLLNDAISLVIYAVALGALAHAGTSLLGIGGQLLWSGAGAIVLGLVVGQLMLFTWSRIGSSELQLIVSLVGPYLAYSAANRLHVSGVLAVVTTGLAVARRTPRVSFRRRGYSRSDFGRRSRSSRMRRSSS